jgi:hypothetical protein
MENLKKVSASIKAKTNEIFKDKRLKKVYWAIYPTYDSIEEKYHNQMIHPPHSHATHITSRGEKGYSRSNISSHIIIIRRGDSVGKIITNDINSISSSFKIPKAILLKAKYSSYRIYK